MNQVLAASQSGIRVEPRGMIPSMVRTAITRLATASINATEVGDGSLIVDEAFVYWPATNTWRAMASTTNHGYGIDGLIKAVVREAQAAVARGYVE